MRGKINDYELIKLVAAYPVLYDKSKARKQKNVYLKDKAWERIANTVNASERACITRWKSLRDRFAKEYKRMHEDASLTTSWDLFHHMTFLRDNYNNESLQSVKYEPKERKRKAHSLNSTKGGIDEDMNEDEIILTSQLITLVKGYPVLYDKKKIRDSKNVLAKNTAWEEISRTLGIDGEECFNRWKKLRDRFAREYRNKLIFPENSVTWIYYSELTFLCEHYRKGIPLPLDAVLKGRNKVRKTEKSEELEFNDNINNKIYSSNVCSTTNKQLIEINEHKSVNAYENSIKNKNIAEEDSVISYVPVANTSATRTENSAQDMLCSAMEDVASALEKSKKCLQFMSEENQRLQQEHNLKLYTEPNFIQKVSILLHGLSVPNRSNVEKKIINFLQECKTKSQNNDLIDDLCE